MVITADELKFWSHLSLSTLTTYAVLGCFYCPHF